jgi:hypothetical protein
MRITEKVAGRLEVPARAPQRAPGQPCADRLDVIDRTQWHFSAAIVTPTFAVYAAGVLAALLLAGRSCDRIGRKIAVGPRSRAAWPPPAVWHHQSGGARPYPPASSRATAA